MTAIIIPLPTAQTVEQRAERSTHRAWQEAYHRFRARPCHATYKAMEQARQTWADTIAPSFGGGVSHG